MRRVNWVCERCGALCKAGKDCPRCGPAQRSKGGGPTAKRDDSRYRYREGYGAGYAAARQTACERQGGRCAICGKTCAVYDGGRWKTRGMGEVHHVTPLSKGGGSDAGNLALLCLACHAMIDGRSVKRRRG